jgi:hypothetical protein
MHHSTLTTGVLAIFICDLIGLYSSETSFRERSFYSGLAHKIVIIVRKSDAHGRNYDYFRGNTNPVEAVESNLWGEVAVA